MRCNYLKWLPSKPEFHFATHPSTNTRLRKASAAISSSADKKGGSAPQAPRRAEVTKPNIFAARGLDGPVLI